MWRSAGLALSMTDEPATAPTVYHGYVIVPDTCVDGWCLGVMSNHEDPHGVDSGDAFVVAPDGSRADLLWQVGTEPVEQILPADDQRWGVFAVSFPFPVRNGADLARAFHSVLPMLKDAFAGVRRPGAQGP